jgi:hypothetical protein
MWLPLSRTFVRDRFWLSPLTCAGSLRASAFGGDPRLFDDGARGGARGDFPRGVERSQTEASERIASQTAHQSPSDNARITTNAALRVSREMAWQVDRWGFRTLC